MSKKRLSMLSWGIFYSKLVYCLARNVSGMQNYREGAGVAGMTADACNKLQVIQNSLSRLFTDAKKGTPTKTSWRERAPWQSCRWWRTTHYQCCTRWYRKASLEVLRPCFIYRGANLFNSLTLSIREKYKTKVFKARVKKWVKENFGIKPNI